MKRAQLLLSRAAKLFRRKPPEPPPAKQLSKAMSAGVAESRRVRDYDGALRLAMSELEKFQGVQSLERLDYRVRVHELVEARQMAGAGPWLVAESRAAINRPGRYREANPIISQGATGDIELALQNVEWRREVNLSWLEFSRWGIQQIILICRLYYLKHPWIRRGINLSAAYVFGQGVELSSPDPDANELLKSFREGNKMTLGQIALTECERRKSYDGNLFWAIFADKENTGEVQVRIIDATEIADIITNPEDSSQPWYYRRVWTQRTFDAASGSVGTTSREAWYPALNYEPEAATRQRSINGIDVDWGTPVYHRKCGSVAQWLFGCPRVYPALDWSREGRKFLEAYASVWQALHQIALTITTKGGQQAIEGIKNQFQTSVGSTSLLWDTNPAAVSASTFASGPGTKLEAFDSKAAGGDPSRVKEFRNMVACCLEIPPTWLGDMETSNLSTAQTLDRPTELGFMLKQEEWQEDLVVLATWALKISALAPSGKLKEAMDRRQQAAVQIREASRRMVDAHWIYEAAKTQRPDVIEILATFPAIREGDRDKEVAAIVRAMTLENKAGQVIGIDEKAGVRKLYTALGIDGADELTEEQYPEGEYDPDRTTEIIPPPIQRPKAFPGGVQPSPSEVRDQPGEVTPGTKPTTEKVQEALARLERGLEIWEASRNGHG